MNTRSFFAQLGLTSLEEQIFVQVYKWGEQPASVIARNLAMERTTVYKNLLRLADENLVMVSQKEGTKHFSIPDISLLKTYIQSKRRKLYDLELSYEEVEREFHALDKHHQTQVPKFRLFEGTEGVKNAYQDMVHHIQKKGYLSIAFFGSNLFAEQIERHPEVKKMSQQFFENLQQNHVTVDAVVGNGVLIMEDLAKIAPLDGETIHRLPVGNSAINIFIIGDVVYVMLYKTPPFVLRIQNLEFAQVIRMLLEHVG